MRTLNSLSRGLLAGVLAASVLAACSPAPTAVNSVDPVMTGSLEAESQYGALSTAQSAKGMKAYVAGEQIRLRKSPEVPSDPNNNNIAGTIVMNDVVEILESDRIGNEEFMKVKVIETLNADMKGKKAYASAKYLNPTPTQRLSKSAVESTGTNRFVITNVATETVRLYRRCIAPETCVNKMLMQFKATVGDDSKEMRSDVGVYKATSWTKFYQSGPYAGWYRPGYPALPAVGKTRSWLSKEFSPPGFNGPRGAFGWFTLFVGPNNSGQWMHGTTGWGADKNKNVRFQDSFGGGLINIFAKLGSHGCTRMSNEAIAYMRSNIPVGATYIKIYAKESVKDASLDGYTREPGRFDYIITTRGYGKDNTLHETADRATVLRNGTPESEWLEQGTFAFNQTPSVEKGDHYGIGQTYGTFNVDEGTVSADYRHPVNKKLNVGGYPGREGALPSYVRESAATLSNPAQP